MAKKQYLYFLVFYIQCMFALVLLDVCSYSLCLLVLMDLFFEFRHLFSFSTFSLFVLPGPTERVRA